MKTFINTFLVLSILISGNLFSQKIVSEDILQREFISKFISNLEANYRLEKIEIPNNIISDLKNLKIEYESKQSIIFPPTPTEKNALKEATKSYYNYYPDVSAVFLNRNNQFNVKLSDEEKTKYNTILVDIWKKIPNSLFQKVSDITDKINKEKFLLTFPYKSDIYSNFFDDAVRKRNDVINYLLWKL